MTITTLLFDLDNTLFDQQTLLKKWMYTCISQTQANVLLNTMDLNNCDDIQSSRNLFHQLEKLSRTPYKILRQHYQQFLWQNIRLDQQIIQLLVSLQKTYKMAIISNGSRSNQQRKLQKTELKHYFQQITISGEVGIRKPHPEVFTRTLQLLGRLPDESLFIGDSLKNDIHGAASVGMKTCWINTHAFPKNLQFIADYHINSINELETILPK